jgi:hypothetical protein
MSLAALRAGSRAGVWRAKLSAAGLLALAFAAIIFVAATVSSAGGHSSATAWSGAYGEVMRAVASNADGNVPPLYRMLADNGYLFAALHPLSAVALQFAVFLFALLLLGAVCSLLSSFADRSGMALLPALGWLVLGLIPPEGPLQVLPFLSPMPHMLTEIRSAAFPYWLSFAFLGGSALVLSLLGRSRARSEKLV